MKNELLNIPWRCPRCGEVHIITEDGIDHTSNVGGFHFMRWSLEDLAAFKKWEKEEFKKWNIYE